MNANELADWIKVTEFYNNTDNHFINDTMDEVEAMLRQQQEKLIKYELRNVAQRDRIAILEAKNKQQAEEIEALKLQLHTTLTNRDLRTYDGKLK